MGLLTFATMQEQVRQNLGGRTEKDALIMTALRIAQVRLARAYGYEELFATPDTVTIDTTGTGNELTDATLTLPSNIRKLYTLSIVEDSTFRKLEAMSVVEWEEKVSTPEIYGRMKPARYVQRNFTVTLDRAPDDEYTIRRVYSTWPTDIALNGAGDAPSSSTAVSDLDNKDDLLITYATVWCFLTLRQREDANYFFSIFKEMTGGAIEFDDERPDLTQDASSHDLGVPPYTMPRFGRK